MNILYFSFVELDIPNACQAHTLGVLEGFSKNGCHIHALVPRPLIIKPNISTVQFHYLWPWRFSYYGRIWIKLLSFLTMFYLCLKNKYDVIYVREMELNPGPRLCSKLFHIPLYIEINDLITVVQSENKMPKKIVKITKNQKKDLEQSTGLIVPSVPMCKWFSQKYGINDNKIHLILNGTSVFQNRKLSRVEARKRFSIAEKDLCLAFVGNLYKEYDFNTIFKAILKFEKKNNNIRLIIIGDGPLYKQLKKNVAELEISSKTIFTGYIPQEKLGKILPAADVGLLIRTKMGTKRYGPISTKLSTYAYFKLPVIVSGTSLNGYPDELIKNLYLIPPGNSSALNDMLLHLYKHSYEKKQKAYALHKFVWNNLTWEKVTKKILRIMNKDLQIKKQFNKFLADEKMINRYE
jgi:glycosyltransferase involved in cell wall biosynthesis